MSGIGEPTSPGNNDKQSAKDANGTRDARQNQRRPQAATDATPTTNILPPLPHELTAEWTVRAQLTFARAGEKVQREFSSNDPVNPVRVVYKWSAFDSPLPPDDVDGGDDDDVDIVDNSSSSTLHTKQHSFGSRGSSQSTTLKSAQHNRRWQPQTQHESFRSTTSSTNAGDFGGGDSAFSGSNTSKQRQRPYQRQPRSASGGPNGVGGATTGAPLYGTRCRSTCNIVVSAVADFLPTDVATGGTAAAASSSAAPNADAMGRGCASEGAKATVTDFIAQDEPDPFVFNTTASYTVLPQKSIDSVTSTGSKNFSTFNKVLALRDAFSQTSDTETKYFEERDREYERRRYAANSRSPIDRRRGGDQEELRERKPYEQRRDTTERLLQAHGGSHPSGDYYVDEANSLTPSFLTSPTHTFKSASMSRIPTMPQQARTQQQQQQQMLASKQKSNSSEPLKKPRTVHIDVYCTGSEDEDGAEDGAEGEDEADNADAEASASSDTTDDEDASKHHDMESNSTPQTVFDNEQMLLKHRRITGQALPRRMQQQQQPPKTEQSAQPKQQRPGDLNIGHAITKSSTAEEVSESKQLLFRKHIGDQRAAKLATLRQKYMRQPSDDAISSNYPNSSRSTVRDATCSSIASSIVTSSQADYGDTSLKAHEDPEEMYSLTKSDSFEYENSQDRLRIKQMERFWQRTCSLDETTTLTAGGQRQMLAASPVRSAGLQPISEVSASTQGKRQDLSMLSESENLSETSDIFYTYPGAMGTAHMMQRASPAHLQQTSHFPRHRPGFLQFFGPSASPSPQHQQQQTHSKSPTPTTASDLSPTHAHLIYTGKQSPHMQRWKSEARESVERTATPATTEMISPAFQRSGSEAPPTTTSAATFQQSPPMITRRFDIRHDSPAVSEASTCYIGYTQEHLSKAKKFGAVIVAVRKPGHHVGPTKNPNCSCESCQRWLAERFQVRSRAFSLGERPILRRPT